MHLYLCKWYKCLCNMCRPTTGAYTHQQCMCIYLCLYPPLSFLHTRFYVLKIQTHTPNVIKNYV